MNAKDGTGSDHANVLRTSEDLFPTSVERFFRVAGGLGGELARELPERRDIVVNVRVRVLN